MKEKVYAVLLAGGKGTRLWPLSTGSCSKSFVSIGNRKPLITDTIHRTEALINKGHMLIVVDRAQERMLKKFAAGIPGRNILVEPFGRSTASAIGLAAIELRADDVMVVLPTDALIENVPAFRRTIRRGINFIRNQKGSLLCIGLKPKEASTAYGYIKIKARGIDGVHPVHKFIEKPDIKKARKLVRRKDHLWNAGMFLFRAGDILEAMKKHAPKLYRELLLIRKNKKNKIPAYSKMRNVSIDFQIMEKAKNLYCVKGEFSWRDLGSWISVGELLPESGGRKDKKGNICYGKVSLVNCSDTIVYNSEPVRLGLVGLRGMIVANTNNGALFCSKIDAQKIKKIAA